MTQLQAGDMAPDFKSTTQDGAALTLADHLLLNMTSRLDQIKKVYGK